MSLSSAPFELDFTIDRSSRSQKAALCGVARRIASLRSGLSADELARTFLSRERLGSTRIGGGVAAPHAILETDCTGLIQVNRLCEALQFDADDAGTVDLLLTVVGHRSDLRWLHATLSRISRIAKSPALTTELRAARSIAEVQSVTTQVGLAAVPAAEETV